MAEKVYDKKGAESISPINGNTRAPFSCIRSKLYNISVRQLDLGLTLGQTKRDPVEDHASVVY